MPETKPKETEVMEGSLHEAHQCRCNGQCRNCRCRVEHTEEPTD